jgi:hypothetical protein
LSQYSLHWSPHSSHRAPFHSSSYFLHCLNIPCTGLRTPFTGLHFIQFVFTLPALSPYSPHSFH